MNGIGYVFPFFFSQWALWLLALAVFTRGPFWTPSSHKFPTHSAGGVILFDFVVVVQKGSKLHIGGIPSPVYICHVHENYILRRISKYVYSG